VITISLCMIVKNEEATLGNCLESVQGIVDEINIVDTGSTDRTKEIASKYTDRIFDFTWIDDFSAARNFSFSKATKDYILWLDGDDVILEEDRQKFFTLKETLDPAVDSVMMKYNTSFDEYGNVVVSFKRNRLVKRSKQFQWHGLVHEYLGVGGNVIQSDIAVSHKKVRPNEPGRNLKIFEKAIADGKRLSARDLFYYANECKDNALFEKAIEYYFKFLETKQCWVEDIISAYGSIALCYQYLGNPEKELEYTLKSFEWDIPRAEFCCRLGFHFLNKKDYKKALFWYKLATQVERPDSWGFFIEACWTWMPHLQLCVCYDRLGDPQKAYEHNEIARRYRPNDACILHNKQYLERVLNISQTTAEAR